MDILRGRASKDLDTFSGLLVHLFRLAPVEEPPHHAACDVPGHTCGGEGASCYVGRLAELVAPGERKGVCDGQGQCNSYHHDAVSLHTVPFPPSLRGTKWAPCAKLTNKRQPDEHEAHEGQYCQRDPQQRLDVVGKPEEAAVRGVDGLGPRLAALKHPLGVARGRVDLVPPAQPDEPAASYVFQVVEVAREEEDGDDEDEDAVFRAQFELATAF